MNNDATGEETETETEKEKEKTETNVIKQFLHKLYSLSIGKPNTRIRLQVAQELVMIGYTIPDKLEIPAAKFGFKILFSLLSVENIIKIVRTALLEKTIVFYGSSLRKVTSAIFGMFPLLLPFKWQGALVPILSPELITIIDSPVPVIIGITQFPKDHDFSSNFLLVDLEKNTVNYSQNQVSLNQEKSSLPRIPYSGKLISSIKNLFRNMSVNNNNNSMYNSYGIDNGKSNFPFLFNENLSKSSNAENLYSYKMNQCETITCEAILEIFENYYTYLFSDFRRHTFSDVSSKKNAVSIFFKDSFLEAILDEEGYDFMESFVDSQCFEVYSNDRLRKVQEKVKSSIKNFSINPNQKNFCKINIYFEDETDNTDNSAERNSKSKGSGKSKNNSNNKNKGKNKNKNKSKNKNNNRTFQKDNKHNFKIKLELKILDIEPNFSPKLKNSKYQQKCEDEQLMKLDRRKLRRKSTQLCRTQSLPNVKTSKSKTPKARKTNMGSNLKKNTPSKWREKFKWKKKN